MPPKHPQPHPRSSGSGVGSESGSRSASWARASRRSSCISLMRKKLSAVRITATAASFPICSHVGAIAVVRTSEGELEFEGEGEVAGDEEADPVEPRRLPLHHRQGEPVDR